MQQVQVQASSSREGYTPAGGAHPQTQLRRTLKNSQLKNQKKYWRGEFELAVEPFLHPGLESRSLEVGKSA